MIADDADASSMHSSREIARIQSIPGQMCPIKFPVLLMFGAPQVHVGDCIKSSKTQRQSPEQLKSLLIKSMSETAWGGDNDVVLRRTCLISERHCQSPDIFTREVIMACLLSVSRKYGWRTVK